VDNNHLDLGMNKSGFVHTLPSGRLSRITMIFIKYIHKNKQKIINRWHQIKVSAINKYYSKTMLSTVITHLTEPIN
jgi:hypothetical protein